MRNSREHRLRQRIDELTDARDRANRTLARLEAAGLIIVPPSTRARHCPYCGRVCHGAACHAHTDLLVLDPHMSEYDPESAGAPGGGLRQSLPRAGRPLSSSPSGTMNGVEGHVNSGRKQ